MGLSHTVSKIDGYFSRKSQNFLTPLYFAPLPKGFTLELGIGNGGQKRRMMGLTGQQRNMTISSAVWTLDGMQERDRRTPGYSKDRAYAQHHTIIKLKMCLQQTILLAFIFPSKLYLEFTVRPRLSL